MADQLPPLAEPPGTPPAQSPAQGAAPLLRTPQEAQNFFSDPDAMYEVAKAMVANRQPEYLGWLERGHLAAKENAIEAAQHLVAGNADQAIKAFNKGGAIRDAVSADNNGDGTWTIKTQSGKSMTINPESELRATMNPKDYFANQVAQRTAAAHETTAAAATTQARAHEQAVTNEGLYQEGMLKVHAADTTQRSEAAAARLREDQLRFQSQKDIQAAHDTARTSIAEAQGKMREALSKLGPQGVYQGIVDTLQKSGAAKPEDIPRLAAEHLLRSTASVQQLGDKWVIAGLTPDGTASAVASFDSEATAREEYLKFFKGGPVPTTAGTAPAKAAEKGIFTRIGEAFSSSGPATPERPNLPIEQRRGGFYINAAPKSAAAALNGKSFPSFEAAKAALDALGQQEAPPKRSVYSGGLASH